MPETPLSPPAPPAASSPAAPAPSGAVLTGGPVGRHLLRLSVPMVWGIAAVIGFQLVDMYFIGLLGTAELAAVSFTFPIAYLVFGLMMAQGIALSSVLARQIGRGRALRGRRLATHGVVFAALGGLVFTALGLATLDPLFRLMGAQPAQLVLIRDYMVTWYAGAVFLSVLLAGNAVLRAGGDTTVPAIIMVSATLLKTLLDPVLIFGLGPAPALGVRGAALASVIADVLAMGACLYILFIRRNMLCPGRRHWRLFGASLRAFLFIAVPVGLGGMIGPAAVAFITALLAPYGEAAVAAFGIVSRIEAFAFIVIMALAVGMGPLIGQNFGAGQLDRVRETLRVAIGFSVLWCLLVTAVLLPGGGAVARLFSNEGAVVSLAASYFAIVALTYAPANLMPGWSSAFNAMGMPGRSFAMIVIRWVVLIVPAAVLGGHLAGVTGIFAAMALVNVAGGLGFHFYNRRVMARL